MDWQKLQGRATLHTVFHSFTIAIKCEAFKSFLRTVPTNFNHLLQRTVYFIIIICYFYQLYILEDCIVYFYIVM